MDVRAAEPADLEAIAAVYRWYVEHSAATFTLEAPTTHEWNSSWESAIEHGFPWHVGVDRGELIGYASTGRLFPRRGYDSTVVSSIYIDRAHVGRGLGRPLYEATIQALHASPFHLAVAGITLPNAASVALHETLGFTSVGIFREVGHKLGAWRDVGWWQLPLNG